MQMSLYNTIAIEDNNWLSERPLHEVAKPLKDLAIIIRFLSKSDHNRRAIRTASSATSALSVIGRTWRYVPKEYSVQSSNINSKLHRGGGRKDISDARFKKVLQALIFLRRELSRVLFSPEA